MNVMNVIETPWGGDYASVDGNHPPDTTAAKQSGCAFIYQRALGDGRQPVPDPHFTRDRSSWNAAKVPFGGYLIMSWPTKRGTVAEPEAQAQKFIDIYGPLRPGELPPALDIEFGFPNGRKDTVLSARQAIEWVARAKAVLERVYGVITDYTSARVWLEDLLDLPADALANCLLWIKTGYYHDARQPFDTNNYTKIHQLPRPWTSAHSPGAWLHQIQGDAKNVPGFSSTVDVNMFLSMRRGEISERVKWVQEIICAKVDGDFGPGTEQVLKAFQGGAFQPATGVVDVKTLVELCRVKSAQIIANL